MTQTTFQKGAPAGFVLEYPMTEARLAELNAYIDETGNPSQLVCPTVGKRHRSNAPLEFGSFAFDEALADVLQVRSETIEEQWSWWYHEKHWPFKFSFVPEVAQPLHAHMDISKPSTGAALVGMDKPEHFPIYMMDWALANGATFKNATRHNDFALRQVLLEDIADGIKRAQQQFFEVKWYWGAIRPEEALGIQGNIVTPYGPGCPCHPSKWAGHARFAAVVTVLDKHLLMPDWVKQQIDTATFQFAFFRTHAAVHFAEDNLGGLKGGGLF